MLERLLKVGDLSGELALRRPVLRILFFDFGQVLELNGLAFEDGALHVFDHLLLLESELVVSELHPVDLLAHGHDLGLANGGVERVLHLFLKGDLPLPKQDLSLCLHNLGKDLGLLLLLLGNLVLQLDSLILQLLQLLLKLVLNILVLVVQLLLLIRVFVEHAIQTSHLKVKVLQRNLQLSDLLVVALHCVVKAHLLLLQNRLFVP